MKPAIEFLVELRSKGVNVSTARDQLVCEAPPGALTPDLRERMIAHKPEILRLLSSISASNETEFAEGPLALSRGQNSIWLLEQINPGTSIWNVSWAVDIRGPLDREALQKSFRALLERHDALRCRFINRDGTPAVEHRPIGDWSFDYDDLRDLPDPDGSVAALAKEEAQRPFDLENGPLIRARLLQAADDAYVLVVVVHHIVADGWSLGLIGRDLTQFYQAFLFGARPSLPPLRADYQAYVRRARRDEEKSLADLAWWREKLSGELPILSLADDAARVPSGAGRRISIPFGPRLTSRIEALAKQYSATPFMVVLAAFKLLLFRYTGQTDILVGVQTSGRNRPEFADVIGMFVNTVVLRTGLSPDLSFVDLLKQVRETSIESFARQEVPFDLVVDAVKPPRTLGHTPLIRHAIAYQNLPLGPLRLGQADLSHKPLDLAGSRYEIAAEFWPTPNGLICDFEYARDLFHPDTIHRLINHYRNLLDAIVEDPARPVSLLPMLSEPERVQLLTEWNGVSQRYPIEQRLDELFGRQAEKTPDAIALIHRDREISYRELNGRANQLAHHLRDLGVDSDVLVGVCLDRSPDLIVAIMAVLKAGGAYVPLDPAYPIQRLVYMLEDSRAPVLITRSALGVALPHTGRIVDIEAIQDRVAAQPLTAPAITATADNLAYVLYTSGSTGRPKGTMLRHSAGYLVDWARRAFSPEEISRIVAGTSICFDLSVFEIFVPLCTGGAVILVANPLDPPDPNSRPTMLNTVPSALAHLAQTRGIPDSVRSVIACGEKLTNAVVQAVYGAAEVERVYNLYGPTEYTTYATMALTSRGAERDPPIGRPLTNTSVYVLDAQLQLTPIGVVGELYISGHGLSRGYLNRPELTAERFLENPFGPPGSRMYKTGDLVRWSREGQLEFVGRVDHQVKIRGFRVELGEVEASLMRHPSIREAVVAAREDGASGPQLVAYVVADGAAPPPAELRRYVLDWLPEYMAPSAFVTMPAFPLTPSGKVDRSALPQPSVSVNAGSADGPPSSPMEEFIVDTFKETLGVDHVGSGDNFFELGGHSLLVVEAAARLERFLEQRVAPGWLFQAPTPRELAQMLETTRVPARGHISVLQPLGERPPLFCLHDLIGTLTYVSLARHLGPHQPVFGLAPGPLEEQVIANPSFDVLTPAYLAAIRSIQPHGPYRIVGYSFGGVPAFELARTLHEAGEMVLLILIDPFIFRTRPNPIQLAAWIARRAYKRLCEIWRSGQSIPAKVKDTTNWSGWQGRRVVRKLFAAMKMMRATWNRVLPLQVPDGVPASGRPLALSLLQAERAYPFRPYKGRTIFLQATVRDVSLDFLNLDGLNGWRSFLQGPLSRIEIEARHLPMMREPLVSRVAQALLEIER
jgi:amino acid adenylation domain-containing protein